MTIKELIASKLRPIGDAIREKDGSTELIPIDDMPQAIRDIQGGGGATVTKQGVWVGTQVQNSGYVEKIYFNTNLSVEEVKSILDSLELISLEIVGAGGVGYFPFVIDTDNYLLIYKNSLTGNYFINNCKNGDVIMLFTNSQEQDVPVGWQVNYNFIEFNSNNLASQYASQLGQTMQNDKLTELFSTTPFTQGVGETVTLSGEYDGATYQATENTIDIKALLEEKKLPLAIKGSGTPVEVSKLPSVGVDGAIYKLNGAPDVYAVAGTEAMSMKEMLANEGFIITVEIVDTLPTENIKVVDMTTGAAPLYYSKQDSKVWGYMDGTWVDFLLFMFEVDLTAQLVYGLENITYPTNEGEMLVYVVVPSELYKYANGEYVKIDKLPVINSQEWLGTKVPNYGTVEKVYINTSLSVEEVVSLLESLEYITNPLDTEILIYPLVTNENLSNSLSCTKYHNEIDNVTYYSIWENVNGVLTQLFKNISLENGEWVVPGWITNKNEVAIGYENALETLSSAYGVTLQNDKLTSLFSLTPFTKQVTLSGEYVSAGTYEFTGNQLIDLTATYLKDKEIPLKIKINVDKAEWLLYRNYTELFNEAAFEIKSYASYSAQSLESINFPNVTHIRTGAFAWCVNLSKINMPKLTVISEQAFMQCQALISLKLVTIGSIYHEAFSGCAKLETVDLGSDLTTLANNAFDGCSSLKKLVIRTENTMIKWYDQLSNCAHFNGTVDSTYNPNGDKDGYIYVPDSLVDTYKNDIGTTGNGWNQYADQIKPLSEYVEE